MIKLGKIDHDNWRDVVKLKVAPGQENFVASNMYSLAEGYVDSIENDLPPMTFAIYNNDELVGFAMMEHEEMEEGEYIYDTFGDKAIYNFFRFMIDAKHQGKGYGREAMIKIIDFLKSFPQGPVDSICLSYEPENSVAQKLYASLGFVETGYIDDGEMLARLGLDIAK